jgi:DNA ligase-1
VRHVLLADLVGASGAVHAARKRTAKVAAMADALAATDPGDVAAVATFLAGEPTRQPLSVGPATLWAAATPPAEKPSFTVADLDAAFARIAATHGPGAPNARTEAVSELLARATSDEQQFVAGLILGELRQGALGGLAAQAIARAFGLDQERVRRALMLRADLGEVAAAAAAGGSEALAAFRLEGGRPVQPMLAVAAADVDAALEDLRSAVVEAKLDGARMQAHRQGGGVCVYSRSLREITDQLPGVARLVASLPATSLVLDGEVLGLDLKGRPEPFQQTMRRFGGEADLDRGGRPEAAGVTPFFFDVLHADGRELLDEPLRTRREALADLVPEAHRVDGAVVDDVADARAVAERALAAGHEGVVVKDLEAPYAAGRRGSAWRKVKPAHTLDLGVVAAEWGHGRRKGWLSNLHLGAVDEATGEPVMLGKTFKGLTDELLAWQTRRFLELERAREGHVVHLEPTQVVEVAVDGVQSSPRYPAGLALRFARVLRHRDDKSADEADTVATVRALHEGCRHLTA